MKSLVHPWCVLGLIGVLGGSACGPAEKARTFALHETIREPQGRSFEIITKKCTDWWEYGDSPDELSACIAMGTADYCGSGQSNTLDGTPIDIYDVIGKHDINIYPPPPPPEPTYYFEAGWTPGYTDDNDVYHPAKAFCLSKKRWATLPLGGPCPLALPDPRVRADARYCEDLAGGVDSIKLDPIPDTATLELLMQNNVWLFNRSGILDTSLQQWSDGVHFLASSRGEDAPRAEDASPHFTPPPEATSYAPFYRNAPTPESLEGVLFTQDAYALLNEKKWPLVADASLDSQLALQPDALIALVTYENAGPGGGYLTTSENPPPDTAAGPGILEGYLFKDPPAGLTWMPAAFQGAVKPLYRFSKATPQGAIYLTSTTQPEDFQYDRMGPCNPSSPLPLCPLPEGYLLRVP